MNPSDPSGTVSSKASLHFRIRMLDLIAGISTDFLELAPADLDAAIDRVLASIGRLAGGDRAYVFDVSEDGRLASITHEWCGEGTLPARPGLQHVPVERWPWMMSCLARGDPVRVSNLEDLPPHAAQDRVALEAQGVRSLIGVPLFCGERLAGFVCIDTAHERRAWPADLVTLLRVAGEVFTGTRERHAMQARLATREAMLGVAARNLPACVFRRVLHAGGVAAYHHLGEGRDRVYGIPAADLAADPECLARAIHPDDRPAWRGALAASAEALSPLDVEFRIVPGDGRQRWIREIAEVRRCEDGDVVWDGVALEVSEQRRVHEALKAEHERLQTYLDVSAAIVVVIGRDETVQLVNRRGCELLGHREEEIVGRNWFERFVPAEQAESVRHAFRMMMEEVRSAVPYHESPVLSAAGEQRLIGWHQRVLHDARGEPTSALASGEDVTDRRRDEAALRESEERFRDLIEGSIQGILIHRDFRPLFANRAIAEILGYSGPEDILAMDSIAPLFRPRELARLRAYNEARQRGEPSPARYELEAVRRNGDSVILENSARRVTWQGEPAVQATFVDVTERRRAEEELQYRVLFETLITNISASFINLGPEEIDAGIDDALRNIGRFAAADRSYVFLFSDDKSTFSNTHEWSAEGVARAYAELRDVPCSRMPWFMERQTRGELLHVPQVEDLPAQAEAERELLRRHSVRSLVCVPMVARGHVIGYLGFDVVREEKSWSHDVIALLRIVGEIFANALERKRTQAALRRSEQRFRDFAETAADWFWETDTSFRFTYCAGRYREVLGIGPERIIGRTRAELIAEFCEDAEEVERRAAAFSGRERFDGVEFTWVRPDGTKRVVSVSGRPIRHEDGGLAGYRGAGRDVTEAHRLAQRIAHQAAHDALTGLANRREFMRRLENALAGARRHGTAYALCYLDLDRFKIVNDAAGHAAGDELLRQVSSVLASKVRSRDTLARLGGDEFSLLLENCPLGKAREVGESLIAAVSDFRFTWESQSFRIGVSIGIVPVTADADNIETLLTRADIACYTAKDLGRNRVQVYAPGDAEFARREGEIVRAAELREALESGCFRLFCAPVRALRPGDAASERYALTVRLDDGHGELLCAETFAPAAERYGIMDEIDRFVVRSALQARTELAAHGATPHLTVPLSRASLGDERLADFVGERLKATGVPPGSVCFELTLTEGQHQLEHAPGVLAAVSDLGCEIALAGFGGGIGSLTCLKRYPVDYVQIDGRLVRNVATEHVDRSVVSALAGLAGTLGLRTVVTEVDSEALLLQLQEIGIDFARGRAVGEPEDIAALTARVAGRAPGDRRA